MANRARVYALLGLACVGVLFASTTVFAADPPPTKNSKWRYEKPIAVTITAPANNSYLPINHWQPLKATATNTDCYSEDEVTWYPYPDDVTTGTTKTNHHIWWTVDEGRIPEKYGYGGVSAWYIAPDHLPGHDIRDVTVTANAVDYNHGLGEERGKKAKKIAIKAF